MWRLRQSASSRRLYNSTPCPTFTTSMHLRKIHYFRRGSAEGCCEKGNERANSTRMGNIFSNWISPRWPGFNTRLVFGTVVGKFQLGRFYQSASSPLPPTVYRRYTMSATDSVVEQFKLEWMDEC
jgi:hypothetical protein